MRISKTQFAARAGGSVAALAIGLMAAAPAWAQAGNAPAPDQSAQADLGSQAASPDIVVTGFRSSLAKALDQKQQAAGSIDTILAEDIGKFPDLNLSEAIQRVPGVALARDAGEGRQISVRGLGAQFTRVRINGMEAIATAGGSDASGGANRGRGFDFNVFAADLFNQITVRKTADAVTEEGSLGATVDLRTARPFDYNGFTLSASAQGSYNDQAKDVRPRAAFLISDTFADNKIGVLFSAAYTERKVLEEGYSTVRWASNDAGVSPGFNSVLGTQCLDASWVAIDPVPAACAEANAALHPRFPRYDYYIENQKRLGLTGSIQFRPTDSTLVSIDGLYADFKGNREERYLEANGFSVAGPCKSNTVGKNCGVAETDVLSETIKNGALIAGTFDNVDLRVENRYDTLDTKFKQLTGDITQKIGDNFTIDLFGGHSQSHFNNPIQDTVTFDQYNIDGYSYDYTDQTHPVFGFGTTDLTDSSGWVLSQLRLRAATVKNTYDTAQLNLTWKVNDEFNVLAGASWKKYSFATTDLRRSNGTSSSQDTNLACCKLPGDTLDKFGRIYTLGGTSFFGPDFFAANKYFGLTDPTARGGTFKLGPEPGLTGNNGVTERDKSAYVEFDFNKDFGGFVFRGNTGVRYVQTHQRTNAFVFDAASDDVLPSVATRTYDDWLPSMNLVFQPTDKFLVRAAAARVMARPDLGSLPPFANVSVSGANRSVSAGNPNLDPYRATTFDLSFEWYYQRGALLSLALFQKNIDSFVQTIRSSGTFSSNPFGLPVSLALAACGSDPTCSPDSNNWTFSVPQNTPGGKLKGLEVNFQQPLRFLPGILSNLGVLLNYTHVESKIKYLDKDGNIAAIADLTGLSRNSANATLYYEDKKFSARVSAAYRDKYLADPIGTQGTDSQGTNSTFNVDASLQYTINDHFKVTAEGINLTNEAQFQYVDSANLQYVYHKTGREYLLGIRFNY
ncbi:MAG TPA: TonB-dependent receptor [Sphingomonas sp.]|nr:TonB-dependent receptor [Sphingomonas sp.]